MSGILHSSSSERSPEIKGRGKMLELRSHPGLFSGAGRGSSLTWVCLCALNSSCSGFQTEIIIAWD